MPTTTRQYRKSWLRRLSIPVFALGAIVYFGFHGLNGNLGLVGRAHIERTTATLERELELLRAKRHLLTRRVQLLRPESLDPDMIDERARAALSLAHPDEIAILRPTRVNPSDRTDSHGTRPSITRPSRADR